jgi:hypothetical protein
MRKAFRIAIGSAALAMGIAAAAPANAQVRFEGRFPLPVPHVSVGFGVPGFAIGTYVPFGYDVYQDPNYGYGFMYQDQWIPCQLYGSRWVIIGSPVFYGRRNFAYARPYQGYRYGFERRGFRDDRRFTSQSRGFGGNRSFGRQDRFPQGSRSNGRRNEQSRGQNRRFSR